MKAALYITLFVAAALAFILGGTMRGGAPNEPRVLMGDRPESAPAAPGDTDEIAPGVASEAAAPDDEAQRSPGAEQQAQAVLDRSIVKSVQSARDDLQAFISEARLLPAQDHEPRARELLARVDLLADAGFVTGPEALALRLSLLEYALPPNDYRAAADELVNDARRRAQQAEREWAERSDPRLESYRIEARRIVEQSATMQAFPDGMTRQDYLQERLRELRSEIYSE